MPKYNVHAFAIVRIKLVNIEAGSQEEAVKKVESDSTNFSEIFDKASYSVSNDIEYAEEVAFYLVDEIGDEDFQNSRWHKGTFNPNER